MENETNSHLVWCSLDADNPDFAPFNELDLAPINYSKDMAQSVYHDCYQTEHLQLWVDNLNLLYVAFTRACKNLIVLGKQKQANSVSELLREAVERLDFMQTPGPTLPVNVRKKATHAKHMSSVLSALSRKAESSRQTG